MHRAYCIFIILSTSIAPANLLRQEDQADASERTTIADRLRSVLTDAAIASTGVSLTSSVRWWQDNLVAISVLPSALQQAVILAQSDETRKVKLADSTNFAEGAELFVFLEKAYDKTRAMISQMPLEMEFLRDDIANFLQVKLFIPSTRVNDAAEAAYQLSAEFAGEAVDAAEKIKARLEGMHSKSSQLSDQMFQLVLSLEKAGQLSLSQEEIVDSVTVQRNRAARVSLGMDAWKTEIDKENDRLTVDAQSLPIEFRLLLLVAQRAFALRSFEEQLELAGSQEDEQEDEPAQVTHERSMGFLRSFNRTLSAIIGVISVANPNRLVAAAGNAALVLKASSFVESLTTHAKGLKHSRHLSTLVRGVMKGLEAVDAYILKHRLVEILKVQQELVLSILAQAEHHDKLLLAASSASRQPNEDPTPLHFVDVIVRAIREDDDISDFGDDCFCTLAMPSTENSQDAVNDAVVYAAAMAAELTASLELMVKIAHLITYQVAALRNAAEQFASGCAAGVCFELPELRQQFDAFMLADGLRVVSCANTLSLIAQMVAELKAELTQMLPTASLQVDSDDDEANRLLDSICDRCDGIVESIRLGFSSWTNEE